MSAQDIALRISENEKALLMTNICKDLTEPEFNLFLKNSIHRGLDPFVGQIVPMVFNKRDPSRRRVTYVTTIDGYRSIASQSGKYEGVTEKKLLVSWKTDKNRDDELISHEMFNPYKHELISATVYGKRSDQPNPTKSTVLMSYYTHLTSDNENWKRSPDRMLLKCAEAQLIRILFPHEMASFYTDEEVHSENIADTRSLNDQDVIDVKPARQSPKNQKSAENSESMPAKPARKLQEHKSMVQSKTNGDQTQIPDQDDPTNDSSVIMQLWAKIETHLRSYPSCNDETIQTARNLAQAHFNVNDLHELSVNDMDDIRKYAKTTMLKELYNLQLLSFERP